MQNNTKVKCIDCNKSYDIEKCSLCSTCNQAGKNKFLCPDHYDKAIDRGKKYFLSDGDCMCFNCWVSLVDEPVESDDEF